MPKPEISPDMRQLVRSFLLTAGVMPGDRVPYEKVVDICEQLGMAVRPKRSPGVDFGVDGIVAVRDGEPYVRLLSSGEPIVQLDIPQSRQVAMDIVQMAARTEVDADIVRFFRGIGLEEDKIMTFMVTLREQRQKRDASPTAEPRV